MTWPWLRISTTSRKLLPRSSVSTAFALLITILLAAIGFLSQTEIRIPPNSLPWEPVDLNASAGWLAHWQLNELGRDGIACRRALLRAPVAVTLLKDRPIDGGCGFHNVVRADRTPPVTFAPRTTATCALTAALVWYQKALEVDAETQLHSGLVRIDQLGTFACRNVNSEAVGPRSQHAIANAIDIAGFHFANGKSAMIVRDYGKSTAEGRFLDAAHEIACSLFNTTLGPRYNRLHATHFHLDLGSYRICR